MTSETLWNMNSTNDAGLEVEILAQPAINLALVHNSVPPLSGLRVTNQSGAAVVDLTVTVQIHGNGAELTPRWSRTYDGELADDTTAAWDDFAGVVPTIAYLRSLNESHPATVAVTVSRLWGSDVHLAVPIKVLAHNEWFNAPIFYDSLAAFVQPNTASVRSVLDGAAELLGAQTGKTSISGYQGGPERAALIAAALYESLRSRGIRYIDPPASFESTGQKVRTTAQVLDERFGTCIDLSVTYAACLEAAGLRPVIWLTRSHSFAGFLREEKHLSHSSIFEQNALVNLVESGIVVPVEAVFYDDSVGGSFSSAIAAAKQHFAHPDTLSGVIDVSAARKDRILPLPSSDEVAESTTIEPKPLVERELSVPDDLRDSDTDRDTVLDVTDTSPARVRKWKRALLDLSTRNRLLNLKPSAQVVDLHVPTSGLAVLDDLIHDGKSITLAPNDDLSSIHQLQGARRAADLDAELVLSNLTDERRVYAAVTKSLYPRRFKELARTARTLLEETGSPNLYLTLGALIHHTSSGAEARAPLFLLPVKIIGGNGRSPFQIVADTTDVATPNYCLVEWLRLKHNVTIDALEKPKLDDSGIDITHSLRGIRAALVDNNIDLRVDEVATVAICQFGTFGMWKDLTDHWDILERSPVVKHLTHTAGESFQDPQATGDQGLDDIDFDETSVPVPIPADGSQLRAVALAAAGRTFVLEGPPGTGKSQTITNLIAHALDQGKTVLFVAEKQAALDVVKKRLENVGLADFTLDLHGKNQRPNAIRAQLKTAIDNTSRYNRNAWIARLAEFRSRYGPVADYPAKVHTPNGTEHSLWRAYEDILSVADGVAASVPSTYVANPVESFTTITDALEHFSRAARSVDVHRGSPWAITGCIPEAVTDDHLSSAASRLAHALSASRSAPRVWSVLASVTDPAGLVDLLPQARRQIGRPVPNDETLAWLRGPAFSATRNALLAEMNHLRQYCAPILSAFTPVFVESGDIDTMAIEATEAGKGLLGRKKRLEQFQRNAAPLTNPGVDCTPDNLLPLLRAIPAAREQILKVKGLAQSLLGPYTSAAWNPLATNSESELSATFEYIEETVAFVDTAPAKWHLLKTAGFPESADIAILEEVSAAWQQWRTVLGTAAGDVQRWQDGDHWLSAWERHDKQWADEAELVSSRRFRNWSQMSGFLAPLRRSGLNDFVDTLLSGVIPAGDAQVAFIRGAAQASLSERRHASRLTNFDTALRDGEIEDFVRAANTMREEQVRALPAALLKRRPFQAGALRDEVGELRRLLDRKRGGASFRQLMARYAEYILAATPCVFVSPTSLAQFIPPGSATFDLVVFDEASQVTVPQAIGALGRGRSAVIVGDSQQMPPTSFGQVTMTDDDEVDEDGGLAPEDLESILTESVESGIPRLWLSWHYRSQDESLIDFSNQKYYEGRLASLPSPGGDATAGVEWRRVPGHFNREDKKHLFRTNMVEAEAIVAEIQNRLSTPRLAGQSIGVVTFNTQQRTLVQDLLDECDDPLIRAQLQPDTEEGIFVKNLENVQGDERDVILFTTAFSKKPGDPKLPLNFGPLSRSGGEKRFNVAVTRARRKVIVFSSFSPSDIDLSRTRSVGLAHLRGYLEMAAQETETFSGAAILADTDVIQSSVCSALRARGYDVEGNYGRSDFVLDIVVREPGTDHWQVAVLLDGPRWAERPTVADRDLTPSLLESIMNWGASVRVWLPDWIDQPESVLDRISEAVETAKERRREYEEALEEAAAARAIEIEEAADRQTDDSLKNAGVTEASIEETEIFDEAPPVDDNEDGSPDLGVKVATALSDSSTDDMGMSLTDRDWDGRGVAYSSAPTTSLGTRDDLDRVNSPSVKSIITAAVRETVEIEGPIALNILARDVGRRFGFNRVAAARKDFVIDSVPPELIHRSPLGDFVWPRQIDRTAWRGYRSTPVDLTRSLGDIAPEEIINAMNAACTVHPLDADSLMRETMSTFNQRRLAGPSRDRLEACIDLGLRNGRIIRAGSMFRAGA